MTPAGHRFQVVATVGDVKNDGLGNPTVPEIYILSFVNFVNKANPVKRAEALPELKDWLKDLSNSRMQPRNPSSAGCRGARSERRLRAQASERRLQKDARRATARAPRLQSSPSSFAGLIFAIRSISETVKPSPRKPLKKAIRPSG